MSDCDYNLENSNHIFIPKARVCRESWWVGAPREGFTALAVEQVVPEPVDLKQPVRGRPRRDAA